MLETWSATCQVPRAKCHVSRAKCHVSRAKCLKIRKNVRSEDLFTNQAMVLTHFLGGIVDIGPDLCYHNASKSACKVASSVLVNGLRFADFAPSVGLSCPDRGPKGRSAHSFLFN